jgi:GDPmannose 4,6-dehydratase
VAKQYAFWMCVNYREAYGMHVSNGILFNHESPRRGKTFVTRKITCGVGDIKRGEKQSISLGNINSKRDWGHAKDYVVAMWLMLQQDTPDDYVISTGETYSVREFVELSFKEIGMTITWKGDGVDEIGIDQDGITRIKINPRYFRPTEVDLLIGSPKKAEDVLGWRRRIDFPSLVRDMVSNDL